MPEPWANLEDAVNWKMQQATATPTATPTRHPDRHADCHADRHADGSAHRRSRRGREDDVLVGPDSPEESIRFVQEQLVYLGLLSSADGQYGRTPRRRSRASRNWSTSNGARTR